MRILATISLLVALFTINPTHPIAGEIYRFVDDQGVVNYVDSIAKVPQRYQIQLLPPEERAKLENPDLARVLLFPYELVENDTLKQGLWEDAHGHEITKARVVSFTRSKASISKTARYKIHFSQGKEEQESLIVYKVTVQADDFTDMKGRPIEFKELSGFMLKQRIPEDDL